MFNLISVTLALSHIFFFIKRERERGKGHFSTITLKVVFLHLVIVISTVVVILSKHYISLLQDFRLECPLHLCRYIQHVIFTEVGVNFRCFITACKLCKIPFYIFFFFCRKKKSIHIWCFKLQRRSILLSVQTVTKRIMVTSNNFNSYMLKLYQLWGGGKDQAYNMHLKWMLRVSN